MFCYQICQLWYSIRHWAPLHGMSCTISHTTAFLLGLDEDLVNDCVQLSIFDYYFKYCKRPEWSSFVLQDTKKWALQSKKVSGLLILRNVESGKYSPVLNTPANSELLGMQGYIKLGPGWHFLPFTASYNLALWYLLLSAFWSWQFWL